MALEAAPMPTSSSWRLALVLLQLTADDICQRALIMKLTSDFHSLADIQKMPIQSYNATWIG